MHAALLRPRTIGYLLLRCSFFLAVMLSVENPGLAQTDSVPFVIPGDDATPTITNRSSLIPAPVSDEFVSVRDGQFHVGENRLKFWGVNLCFGANFPSHEEADKIAPHFAKLGINAVRFHHMDMQDAPGGIWKTLPNGKRELDPDQMDRLDYFLNRLHEHGIYANLNLHVSRTLTEGEGYPQMKRGLWWAASNKWVMYYDQDVQRELKKYCRDLLTHRNPYRGKKRVDDPGVAVVEMMNENYFSKQGIDLLEHLPDRFVNSFGDAWNGWLSGQYKTTEAMNKSWQADHQPLGEFLVQPVAWADSLDGWQLNMDEQGLARGFKIDAPTEVQSSDSGQFAIRLEAVKASEQAHFQQLTKRDFSVVKGQPYTLSFWVRADKKRPFNFEVSTAANDQWRPLGVFETGSADREWKQIQRVFFPEETIENQAYLAMSIGTDATPIEFANVSLRAGAPKVPLPPDQSIEKGNIGVPESGWPLAAHRDLKQFMVDTERSWILELKQHLRDLGVRVPITASQENYHADGLLAETVDFVDLHNYWHHPTFPAGKDFNPTEYRTGNDPMEAEPTRSAWPANSLLMRTGWRYHGMPFTLSEWNHSEPSDVNSGAVMMAAALGAIQDWDGIFFFDYDAGNPDWFRDHFEGFFEFNSQPVKLATFSVAANIFLRGDLSPLKKQLSGTFTDRLDGRLAFDYRLGIDPAATKAEQGKAPATMKFVTPTRSLIWDATVPSTGHLQINVPQTQGAWGLVAEQSFKLADFEFEVGKVLRNYATVIATSMDSKPLNESGSILLLASSGAENTNMQWNADRTSVSNQWGTGPTRVNLVPAKIRIRSNLADRLQVFALDGTGKRTGNVETQSRDNRLSFEIGPDQGTIWFEISVE